MNKGILRIRVQGSVLLLCILMLFLFAGTQKVSAKEAQKLPYLIKVNRACNTITIYGKDDDGKYTIPVKAMVCSVGKGTRTITGTFQTKERYRWKALMGDVWGQYATRIVGGILFHSVYYYENGNPASLATKEFNKLGTAASHGCIRLTVADAKWIYDNCASSTTVVIYDDRKNPGPLGKPKTITLPSKVRWDPTDPSDANPFRDKRPKIFGAKDFTAEVGEEIDLLAGVKAQSSVGTDITADIAVTGDVNTNFPGEYQVTYSVIDALGKATIKEITVIVNGDQSDFRMTGIEDRVVNDEALINEASALDGVEAYYSEMLLDKAYITVTIEETLTDEYSITYQLIINGEAVVTEESAVIVDREAPVLNGVSDLKLAGGEIPSKEFLLNGITASDNYSKPENIKVEAAYEENQDGTFLVTYTAEDEAGNICEAQCTISN